ncbi:hypothetical protein [Tuwongella immobilis]|nr:hypothetical protein [Tuwongella immobilis]
MARSIPIGDQSVFPLVEKAELLVVVEAAVSEDRRVNLSITPPQMKAITYTCRCGKFFPILTRHQTESGERLIIGIMGEPCLKGQKPTP